MRCQLDIYAYTGFTESTSEGGLLGEQACSASFSPDAKDCNFIEVYARLACSRFKATVSQSPKCGGRRRPKFGGISAGVAQGGRRHQRRHALLATP